MFEYMSSFIAATLRTMTYYDELEDYGSHKRFRILSSKPNLLVISHSFSTLNCKVHFRESEK